MLGYSGSDLCRAVFLSNLMYDELCNLYSLSAISSWYFKSMVAVF